MTCTLRPTFDPEFRALETIRDVSEPRTRSVLSKPLDRWRDTMDVDGRYTTFRTLESISRRRCEAVSWKERAMEEAENSACLVDEIDDECFHTSDFEPFSDDDEFELEARLMDAENYYHCTSDISSLDYSLFEPLNPLSDGKLHDPRGRNGSRYCSGLIYMLQSGDTGKWYGNESFGKGLSAG